ncbi:Hypothetical_protein [Hexamita inflata]|uniref:Hypothetical_protein n=1 Tax=Hexamita inflata TaxID=28002 RepID=A0ABP1GHW3_9EUKA
MPPQLIQYYVVTLPQGCDINYNTQRVRTNCKCEVKIYDFGKLLVKVVSGSIHQLGNDGFKIEPALDCDEQKFTNFIEPQIFDEQFQYFIVTLSKNYTMSKAKQIIQANCQCEMKNCDFGKVLLKVVSGSIHQLNNDGFVVELVRDYTQQMFNDFTEPEYLINAIKKQVNGKRQNNNSNRNDQVGGNNQNAQWNDVEPIFKPNTQAINRPYHQGAQNINFQNAIPTTQFSQPHYDKHKFQHPNIPQPPPLPAANHPNYQPPQKVITLQLDVASFGVAFAMKLDDYLAKRFTTCKTQIYNNNILITDTKDVTDRIKTEIDRLYSQYFKVYESEM